MKKRLPSILVFAFIFIIHFGAFFFIKNNGLMMDENYHFAQIQRFIRADYTLDPELPMLPGYHYALAAIGRLFNANSFPQIRFISFLINILSIFIFYKIALKIDQTTAAVKTLQYSFFPLLFPFFSLLYTDLFSLTALLIALLFICQKHYLLSGIIASISILIRQNNIIWLVFLNLLIYLNEFGFALDIPKIKTHLKRTYTFLLGPLIVLLFILQFRGVSVGSITFVKPAIVVPNNLFVMLFLFFFLFLPENLALAKEAIKFWSLRKKYLLLLPIAFLIFNSTFKIEHPYNYGWFFLHNLLLEYATAATLRKFIFFIVMVSSILIIPAVKLHKKAHYILYPFTVIFFLPLWFIEWRYYMIPLTLFLLFRKTRSVSREYLSVLYFIIISFYLFWGISHWKFFI